MAPPGKDIGYATTRRQSAVRARAAVSHVLSIPGSQTSSNSTRLAETARAQGTPAHLSDATDDIDPAWLEGSRTAGISAGASAPESRVREVAKYFESLGATIEEFTTVTETTRFVEPMELSAIKRERMQKEL